MQLKCVIGSLRLNDGTEYSKGNTFSLGDKKAVQSLLALGYVQEVKPKQEKKVVVKEKGKAFGR